ncbi:hypothetical protein QT381_15405 [Galbitalea sp. SE-J8]|uniref:hypothetical protein n=1 Tax=Galbitalea sp. SE-J8 TaxID=3054952 RepID=UPI00259CA935|nr:hypothetical protein [Galbitalea sp. SE-J8]MDM4764386.1 hypothetical protein [Galbitalea sp. SE-J8]
MLFGESATKDLDHELAKWCVDWAPDWLERVVESELFDGKTDVDDSERASLTMRVRKASTLIDAVSTHLTRTERRRATDVLQKVIEALEESGKAINVVRVEDIADAHWEQFARNNPDSKT